MPTSIIILLQYFCIRWIDKYCIRSFTDGKFLNDAQIDNFHIPAIVELIDTFHVLFLLPQQCVRGNHNKKKEELLTMGGTCMLTNRSPNTNKLSWAIN